MKKYFRVAKIYLSIWSTWFLINFILAPLPLLIMTVIPGSNHKILFSSYLSYIFSILVVSAGTLYFQFKKEKFWGEKDVILWINIVIIPFIVGIFVLYNWPDNPVTYYIENKTNFLFWISLFAVIFDSGFLHSSYLNSQVKEQLEALPIELSDEIKKNVERLKTKLEREEDL